MRIFGSIILEEGDSFVALPYFLRLLQGLDEYFSCYETFPESRSQFDRNLRPFLKKFNFFFILKERSHIEEHFHLLSWFSLLLFLFVHFFKYVALRKKYVYFLNK